MIIKNGIEQPSIQESILESSKKYYLNIFSTESIDKLEESIFYKNNEPYLKCFIRNKDILITPEEIVRQLYIDKLLNK